MLNQPCKHKTKTLPETGVVDNTTILGRNLRIKW